MKNIFKVIKDGLKSIININDNCSSIKCKGMSKSVNYSNGNISVSNSSSCSILINGVEVQGLDDSKQIEINVSGDVKTLEVSCGNVNIKGNVLGNISVNNGDIHCKDVAGYIECDCGNITCGDVSGDIECSCGNITTTR